MRIPQNKTIGFFTILFVAATCFADRLAYLEEPCDPYYVGTDFPKLTTPQWVGEENVDAVLILSIDDMRDTGRYEAFLRPILNRLKQIDKRARRSRIFCQIQT